MFVRRLSQTIVHPLSFTPSRDNSGATQIGQVTGNFRLAGFQDGHQKADTDLGVGNQADKSQTRTISEGLKEKLDVVDFLNHFNPLLFAGSAVRAEAYRAIRRSVY
jgi:hypothetical protein